MKLLIGLWHMNMPFNKYMTLCELTRYITYLGWPKKTPSQPVFLLDMKSTIPSKKHLGLCDWMRSESGIQSENQQSCIHSKKSSVFNIIVDKHINKAPGDLWVDKERVKRSMNNKNTFLVRQNCWCVNNRWPEILSIASISVKHYKMKPSRQWNTR